jgi:hypothetical protein
MRKMACVWALRIVASKRAREHDSRHQHKRFLRFRLVIVPVMTHEICTEWQDGHIALLNPPRAPDSCTGLEKVIELIPDDFFIKATVSNLSSDFNTPTGRVRHSSRPPPFLPARPPSLC